MTPSKKAIADYLGLDRSTVSKILNRYELERFNSATVARVEQAARELGFVQAQRRDAPRIPLGALVRVRALLSGGAAHSEGTGVVRDVSRSGFLISDLCLGPGGLPAVPFRLEVEVASGRLAGLRLQGRPVRLVSSPAEERLSIGVALLAVDAPTRERLDSFLDAA
ncbi:MAG: LacI family DNA-binding transcriptional regulator [Planctomycetes bacterium]|nr:LacI family DNA-binding transcriptional regulator [Planctomycetota bacterium]